MYKLIHKSTIIFFCLAVLTACSDIDNPDFLAKAIKLYNQGEYAKAELELKNEIQHNPNNADAYYYMALLNEKSKKFKAMRENLIEAVKLDPKKIESRLKLAKIYLLFNELDKAQSEIESILQIDAEYLDALAVKASILTKQKQYDQVNSLLEHILTQNPSHIDAISLKVLLLIKDNKAKQAMAILNPILQQNNDNLSLNLLKIKIDSRLNDIDAVIADYEKIVTLKPDNAQIKYTLARVYEKVGKNEQADELFRSLINENPQQFGAKLGLLNFLYRTRPVEAFKQLEKFIQADPEDYSLVLRLALWLLDIDQEDKAHTLLNTALNRDGLDNKGKEQIYLMLADIALSHQQYDKAVSYAEKILTINPESLNAKLIQAKYRLAHDQYAEARKLVDKIIWQKPDMDQAITLLAEIYLMEGQRDQAKVKYKEALSINPRNLTALNFIVNEAIEENHPDYATEVLENTLNFMPQQLSLMIRLVEVNIANQNWDNANQYIRRIRQQPGGLYFAEFFKADILEKQNQYQQAIDIYQAILTGYPWHRQALLGLKNCYIQLNRQSEFNQYLSQFIAINPGIVQAYVIKSQLLSADKHNQKAIDFLIDNLANKGIESPEIYLELARLFKHSANEKAEYKTYQDGLERFPDNTDLKLHLASYYERHRLFEQSVKLYDELLQHDGRLTIARNNLATILLDHYGETQDIERALQLAISFKQSKNAYFLDTYGWALFKSKQLDDALNILKKVILLAPDIPIFRYHLALAYIDAGDNFSALSELRQAVNLAKNTDFAEIKQVKALLGQIKKPGR